MNTTKMAYIVDLMALIRTMTKLPKSYEEFVWKLSSAIPKGYNRLDIVVDTYREV